MSNGIKIEIPLIYFRHLKVSWIKTDQISCLFIITSIYPPYKTKGLTVEMYSLAHSFHSTENNREARLVYKYYCFKVLDNDHSSKTNGKVFYHNFFYHNTKVINGVFISCATVQLTEYKPSWQKQKHRQK